MSVRTKLLRILTAVTLAAGVSTATASPAAAAAPTGTSSLAALLAADGSGFDRNWYDFDVLEGAVTAVLTAKPDSPVAVLADGTKPLTAFLPNDRAFQVLAFQLTHRWYGTEQGVLTAIAKKLSVDQIEAVLLYHVVPGATLDSSAVLRSNGAVLQTALAGQTVRVRVLSPHVPLIQLVDGERGNLDPFVVPSKLDLNKGNVQIAHGISFVLMPASL